MKVVFTEDLFKKVDALMTDCDTRIAEAKKVCNDKIREIQAEFNEFIYAQNLMKPDDKYQIDIDNRDVGIMILRVIPTIKAPASNPAQAANSAEATAPGQTAPVPASPQEIKAALQNKKKAH